LSVCHTIVATSQLAKARILLIATTLAPETRISKTLTGGGP